MTGTEGWRTSTYPEAFIEGQRACMSHETWSLGIYRNIGLIVGRQSSPLSHLRCCISDLGTIATQWNCTHNCNACFPNLSVSSSNRDGVIRWQRFVMHRLAYLGSQLESYGMVDCDRPRVIFMRTPSFRGMFGDRGSSSLQLEDEWQSDCGTR